MTPPLLVCCGLATLDVVQRVAAVPGPDEKVVETTLGQLVERLAGEEITRTALIFVGRIFDTPDFRDSRLYEAGFTHYRRGPAS